MSSSELYALPTFLANGLAVAHSLGRTMVIRAVYDPVAVPERPGISYFPSMMSAPAAGPLVSRVGRNAIEPSPTGSP